MLPSHVVRRPARSAARRRGDRGAVLVHAAVAMMGLLAFSALSIDLGTLWVARAQAQNAADAAALSGGVALAYTDPADTAAAQAAARAIALEHRIWGEPIAPASLSMPADCPPDTPPGAGGCMNIVIERGTASGTPLPVFFSRLFGMGSTNLRASASAKVLLGNATPCPRPIAIPDRWIETHPTPDTWTDDDSYDRYDPSGIPIVLPPSVPDSYAPPDASAPGSGMTIADMRGVRITRTLADATTGQPLLAGHMIALDLARPGGHADAALRYEENLGSCRGLPMSIGETVPTVFPHRGYYTTTPILDLIGRDAGAYWDAGSQAIRGSDPQFVVSPRIVTVAVIDPDAFTQQNRSSGADPTVVIRNLIGLFLEEAWEAGGAVQVRGVIVPMAGAYDGDAPSLTDQSTFLRTVALVR